ncbi:MAG: bifunctional pyr operon transcriptional regulator/uracil phosphoribosyltransferase PyrR [Saprospiraceae bacterium]
MSVGKTLLPRERFALTLERLCHQLLEDWGDFSNACIIGIQPRGTLLSNRIYERLKQLTGNQEIEYGKLDITFYRDDFRMGDAPLAPYPNEIDFIVARKKVLLIDDVLYTGRTISAALAALQHYGRPDAVELLVLVDRRFNRELPIQPDYFGIAVDALDEAYIKVRWQETHGDDEILLFENKPK